jgi:hypothetical protein
MMVDPDSGNFLGKGEYSTHHILKQLTFLKSRHLREFPRNGIYKQVPLQWVISRADYNELSEVHKKGSIDLFVILNQKRVAVRVQGPGHGSGNKIHGRYSLKGSGKPKHDKVQEDLIKKNASLVDIKEIECPNVFKERVTENAKIEIINSFKTHKVMIPVSQEMQ